MAMLNVVVVILVLATKENGRGECITKEMGENVIISQKVENVFGIFELIYVGIKGQKCILGHGLYPRLFTYPMTD